jgi:rare lipoprotein A
MRWLLLCLVALPAVGCAARVTPRGPVTGPATVLESREGLASYYGRGFDGKVTASGVRFDAQSMVAAHPTYPFGTVLRVTNLRNHRSVGVRIVDRGPASGPRGKGVIIDLSQGAAQALGFIREGHARVRVEVLEWGRIE